MSKGKCLYLFRHGESEANVLGKFGMDFPLTEKGIGQAIVALENVPDIEAAVTMVLCSDRQRAVCSALRMFPNQNCFIIDRRFREINFGKLEGTPILDEHVVRIQKNPSSIYTFYKGDDIQERVETMLTLLHSYCALGSGDIVLVGHDTLFELFLRYIGYYGDDFVLWAPKFKIPNCGFVKLGFDELDAQRKHFLVK